MIWVLVATALLQFSANSDAPRQTPSPSVLAQAITKFTGQATRPDYVRNIECEGFWYYSPYPMSYVCKWEQKGGYAWHSYTSYFEVKQRQWTMTRKPETDQPIDPSSASERQFRAWLIPRIRKEYLEVREDPKKLDFRYGYTFVDLNDDGQNEAIVLLISDETCGTGGCGMEVEVQRDGHWRTLSYTVRTRPPIKILATKHHGWHDIGVFDAGGGMPKSFESPVVFNGRKYRFSPTDDPVPKAVHGRTVLTDKMIGRPLF
jgi:hypothetical protein